MSKSIYSVFYGIALITTFLMLSGEAFSAPQKTREMAQKSKTAKFEVKPAEGFEEVDLFQAIADGKLDAGVIQAGMQDGKLFIENVSDKPISVRLPETFGTRPILSQNMQQFNQNSSNQNRQLFGSNGQMGGGGGGFMNIPPEKVVAVKYQSLCLEYGKPVPTAANDYELAKIDEVTDKEEVKQICRMLGSVDQKALQFAAWHLNSEVSAQKLASETVLRPNGRRVNFFTPQQIQTALAAIQRAKVIAKQMAAAGEEKTGSSEYPY